MGIDDFAHGFDVLLHVELTETERLAMRIESMVKRIAEQIGGQFSERTITALQSMIPE